MLIVTLPSCSGENSSRILIEHILIAVITDGKLSRWNCWQRLAFRYSAKDLEWLCMLAIHQHGTISNVTAHG